MATSQPMENDNKVRYDWPEGEDCKDWSPSHRSYPNTPYPFLSRTGQGASSSSSYRNFLGLTIKVAPLPNYLPNVTRRQKDDDDDEDDYFSDALEEFRDKTDAENPFSDSAMWSPPACHRPSLADELESADDESRDFKEATASPWPSPLSSDGGSWSPYIFSPTRRSLKQEQQQARNWPWQRNASKSSSMTADFGSGSSSGCWGSPVEDGGVAVFAPHAPSTPDSLLSLPTPRLDFPLTGYFGYATGGSNYVGCAGDEELGLRRETAFMGIVLGFVSGLMFAYALLLYGSSY
ncbi:hypothetical protein MAPG_06271 [Magnaporthiopsis poae ATCC 64411]|uniref:Uncharacterized protein n=1 Tax=Magnaporthiopsis poae (strain ATCC 64411 / 73-15) TaxID=644358 RepID=A0A0C4E1K7_MAGP6|nr:hypothetical protein MAPG_06271 [Magnaporthiopsis poae ATCC 64411]